MDAQELLRRHFEARFKPLTVAPLVPPPKTNVGHDSDDSQNEDDGESDSDLSESEWDGVSDSGESDDEGMQWTTSHEWPGQTIHSFIKLTLRRRCRKSRRRGGRPLIDRKTNRHF
jgi:hypothetical protein